MCCSNAYLVASNLASGRASDNFRAAKKGFPSACLFFMLDSLFHNRRRQNPPEAQNFGTKQVISLAAQPFLKSDTLWSAPPDPFCATLQTTSRRARSQKLRPDLVLVTELPRIIDPHTFGGILVVLIGSLQAHTTQTSQSGGAHPEPPASGGSKHAATLNLESGSPWLRNQFPLRSRNCKSNGSPWQLSVEVILFGRLAWYTRCVSVSRTVPVESCTPC